jgi:hypothetical protein
MYICCVCFCRYWKICEKAGVSTGFSSEGAPILELANWRRRPVVVQKGQRGVWTFVKYVPVLKTVCRSGDYCGESNNRFLYSFRCAGFLTSRSSAFRSAIGFSSLVLTVDKVMGFSLKLSCTISMCWLLALIGLVSSDYRYCISSWSLWTSIVVYLDSIRITTNGSKYFNAPKCVINALRNMSFMKRFSVRLFAESFAALCPSGYGYGELLEGMLCSVL